MRQETLTESKEAVLRLSGDEASALIEAGRRLASTKQWWGDSEPPVDRSVIQCARIGDQDWRVRVVDAIGLISVGGLQIEVMPKIPIHHLLHLFALSGQFPRLDEQQAAAAQGQSLWELVATWFLGEVEKVLRRDLMKGYREEDDALKVVRGRIAPLPTARSYYAGRLEFDCRYEEFNRDTPLNRVLLAASRRVGASPVLGWEDRRRALAAISRMDEVGELSRGDLRAQPTRTTAHYVNAVILARHVLQGEGREPLHGETYAHTFLIRTPEMIEEGIRNLLQAGLGDEWQVEKQGWQLEGSTMTFNPDLVFGGDIAVGDVKYKLAGSDWRRSDLYQIISFATAFGSKHGAVIGFRPPGSKQPPKVLIDDLQVVYLSWGSDQILTAHEAGNLLCEQTRTWLSSVMAMVG